MSKAKHTLLKRIMANIQTKFRTFGAGQKSNWNPVVNATTNKPLQFAAGVDCLEVVKLVLEASGHDALLEACKGLSDLLCQNSLMPMLDLKEVAEIRRAKAIIEQAEKGIGK